MNAKRTKEKAKLPWYMKIKGTKIEFHWLWVLWQRIKVKWWLLVLKRQ